MVDHLFTGQVKVRYSDVSITHLSRFGSVPLHSPNLQLKASISNILLLFLGQSKRAYVIFQGNLVAVGTHRGYVQIWDVAANKKLNVLEGHSARVGALAWNGDSLSSGSRDRLILQRDIRTPPLLQARRLEGHRQEVCGLKWSPDNSYLVKN